MGTDSKLPELAPFQRQPPRSYLLRHGAVGFAAGYVLLHPLSMVIHALTATHGRHMAPAQQITDAFTVEHIPMGLFFAGIGGLVGFLSGRSRYRLRRLYEAAVVLANLDGLTRIFNRRHFDEQLEIESERSRRSGMPLSLLMIDLDGFKAFNDTHGHPKGDDILRYTADHIRLAVRAIDVVARLGGDEFAVLMPQTSEEEAVAVGERIREVFAERFSDTLPPMSLSIGAAEMPESADSALALFAQADKAVYLAKRKGRNCVASRGRQTRLVPNAGESP